MPDAMMGTAQIRARSVTHAVMLLLTAMVDVGWSSPADVEWWWSGCLLVDVEWGLGNGDAQMEVEGGKKRRVFGTEKILGERWRGVLRI